MFAFSAIWQEQVTAVLLFKAGYGLWKGYLVLLCGSSIGIILVFYFPEYITWITRFIAMLVRRALSLNGRRKELSAFELLFVKGWSWVMLQRERLIECITNSNSPKWFIFFATAIPIPVIYLAPIAAARLLRLHRGFTIVYLASVVRSFIIAFYTYRVYIALR